MAATEAADRPGLVGTWGVPFVATLVAVAIVATGSNRALFTRLNGLADLTGDPVWAWLTVLGGGSVAAALLLPAVGRRPALVFAGLLAALGTYAVVETLKVAVDLPRPAAVLAADEVHVIGPSLRKNAFPSGHTATAFALAGLTVQFVLRGPGRLAVVLLATLVGTSRIAVGMHWPLDVAAGAALGWLVALTAAALARRWSWGRATWFQGVIGLALLAAALRAVLEEGRYPQASPWRTTLGLAAIVLSLPGWWRLLTRRKGARVGASVEAG